MSGLEIAMAVLAVAESTKGLISFASDCKNARQERAEIAATASRLLIVLLDLRDQVAEWQDNSPRLLAAQRMAAPSGLLTEYKAILDELAPKSEPGVGWQKVAKDLKWKFAKKEVDKLLLRMNNLMSELSLILDLDQAYVLLG